MVRTLLIGALFAAALNEAQGCSYTVDKDSEGHLVAARTMEYVPPLFINSESLELITNVSYYPRDTITVGALMAEDPTDPSNENGTAIITRNKYAFLAIDNDSLCMQPYLNVCLGLNTPRAAEGMNEKGLTISTLVLKASVYEKPASKNVTVSQVDFNNYVLGNFENANELVAALKDDVAVTSCSSPGAKSWSLIPDMLGSLCLALVAHWAVEDALGNSIVIEYINGELKVYNNTAGTLTNDPPYEFHLTNLQQYRTVSNVAPGKKAPGPTVLRENIGQDMMALSAGFGYKGLPGDYSPPSRFLRLFFNRALSSHSVKDRNRTVQDLLVQQQAVISANYITYGSVGTDTGLGGEALFETPNWTSLKVPSLKTFYWHTYKDLSMKKIDLTNPALTSLTEPVHFPMGGTNPLDNQIGATDITAALASSNKI